MTQALLQFHFLRPWWLLALLLVPLGCWLGLRRHAEQQALSRLVDPQLLPHLLVGQPRQRGLPTLLFALGWTLATLALAGPTWSRVAQPLYAQRAAQVIAISLSRHMLAQDVTPRRIDRALYKARALLTANRDGLNALVGYAGDAFVVAPLTSDVHSLDSLLDALSPEIMPVDGDNAAAAIEQSAGLIHDAHAGNGSIVLITDGVDQAALAAAAKAKAAGVHVSVLGIGTVQGAPVPQAQDNGGFVQTTMDGTYLARRDDAALNALAAAGGGHYVTMQDDAQDIEALKGELHVADAPSVAAGMTGDDWQDRGPWLLLPLLLIAAMAFRRGWLLLLPFTILLPLLSQPAAAASVDWWQRPDQKAAQALRAGQAAKAAQLAQDPALRGAAAYKAGDYASAASTLQSLEAQSRSSDIPYNLGNALAQQGKYAEALKAYDEALKRDPHNADASANRALVEAALKKQPPQPKQQQGNNNSPSGSGGQPSGDNNHKDGKSQQGEHEGKQPDPSGQPSPNQQQDPSSAANKDSPKSASNDVGQDGRQMGEQRHDPSSKPESAQDNKQANDNLKQGIQASDAQQQAAAQAQQDKAAQALQKQMDQALGADGKPGTRPPTHELGAIDADDPQAKLPLDAQRTLQRVPDDPGALLRRKFQLEYRQRQGQAADAEGQP